MHYIYIILNYSNKLYCADKHLVQGVMRPEQPELLRGPDKAGDQQVPGVGQHVHHPLWTHSGTIVNKN